LREGTKVKGNMLNIKLAFKNIFRNKRRTILTLFAIVIGSVGLLLFLGYMNITLWGMRESFIRSRLSHVQIYKKGYFEKGSVEPYKYMISDYDKIKQLLSKEKMVRVVTPRVSINGLIATRDQSKAFIGEGVIPEEDTQLSSFLHIIKGKDLDKKIPDGVVAGTGLATAMNAKVNDGLTIMTSTIEGGINALDVSIQGIMQTGTKEYDDIALKLPISTVQRLLNTKSVTKIFVLLDDTEHVAVFANRLKEIIRDNKLDLEFKTWDELADIYHQTAKFFLAIFSFISIVICVIVIFSIANTLAMSVMERTIEIGTIRAIGATRRSVFKLFLLEGAIIGILGGIIGICFGYLSENLINACKFSVLYPGQQEAVPFRILINNNDVIKCFTGAVIISVLSSVLPAIKASRLMIVDAFRHV
jgi:putative ABC transport system permease protein